MVAPFLNPPDHLSRRSDCIGGQKDSNSTRREFIKKVTGRSTVRIDKGAPFPDNSLKNLVFGKFPDQKGAPDWAS
jgi:hypothetical protein